jgi:hypothetical protein
VDGFIHRMKGVAGGPLHSFEEHTRGMEIMVFGNVAVVLAASEMLENGTETNHDVSGYLLVKDPAPPLKSPPVPRAHPVPARRGCRRTTRN